MCVNPELLESIVPQGTKSPLRKSIIKPRYVRGCVSCRFHVLYTIVLQGTKSPLHRSLDSMPDDRRRRLSIKRVKNGSRGTYIKAHQGHGEGSLKRVYAGTGGGTSFYQKTSKRGHEGRSYLRAHQGHGEGSLKSCTKLMS